MVSNFQTVREFKKPNKTQTSGLFLKHNNLLFSVSEPPQTDISAPTSRTDSRGLVFLLEEQQKRKNGQETTTLLQFAGSV